MRHSDQPLNLDSSSRPSRRQALLLVLVLIIVAACGSQDEIGTPAATSETTVDATPTVAADRTPTLDAGTTSSPIVAVSTATQQTNTTVTPAGDPGGTPVAKQNQTISFEPIGDTTMGAAPIVPTASASSGLPVTFEATGSCSISANSVTLNGVGQCTVVARQPGDNSWNAAADVSHSFAVARGSQTVTLLNPGDHTYAENLVIPLHATASSGLPVSFVIIDDNACPRIEAGSAVISNQGPCEVRAVQEGNADYFPAESAPVQFWINSARGAFVWDDILADRTHPPDGSFQISATAIAGASVQFFAFASSSVCEVIDESSSGNVTTAVVLIRGPGTCTIEASQDDSQNYFGGDPITKSFEIVSSDSSSTPSAP